jgi:putative hydrolase of the HAD superfamily
MKISTVIFDFGCVLSQVPDPADFDPIRQVLGIDSTVFEDVYWRHRDAYDLGHVPTENYWQEVGRLAGRELAVEEAQAIAELDCQIWSRTNPVMIDWIGQLRRDGIKVAVISNMSVYIGVHLRRTATWMQHCDPICLSGELKLLKPDAAIYNECLAKIGGDPAETLFIDDREVNIIAAHKLGMNGIVFKTVDQLTDELKPYGLADSLLRASSANEIA